MNLHIDNFAPNCDLVRLTFKDDSGDNIIVNIERDENNTVYILAKASDGYEHRVVLGQEGYTEKL